MPEGSFEGLEMVITTEVNNSLVAIDKLIAKLGELKTTMNMSGVFTKVTDSTKKLQGAMEQAKAPLDKVSASMDKTGAQSIDDGCKLRDGLRNDS